MIPTKCPCCPRDPVTSTTYRVARFGAEVTHHTCDRCTDPLKVDMIEAGWTVVDA